MAQFPVRARSECIHHLETQGNYPMRRTAKLAAMAAIGVVAWSAPSSVYANVQASTYGGYTEEYSRWQGIAVFDNNCDSNDVYSDYKRDIGTPQVLRMSAGCGEFESSGITGNLIARFNHCTDDAGPNTCSSTKYR